MFGAVRVWARPLRGERGETSEGRLEKPGRRAYPDHPPRGEKTSAERERAVESNQTRERSGDIRNGISAAYGFTVSNSPNSASPSSRYQFRLKIRPIHSHRPGSANQNACFVAIASRVADRCQLLSRKRRRMNATGRCDAARDNPPRPATTAVAPQRR